VFGNQSSRGASANKCVPSKFGFVILRPFQHFVFHVVVGNKRNSLCGGALNIHHDGGGHDPSVSGF
jgi:hypothetical protein